MAQKNKTNSSRKPKIDSHKIWFIVIILLVAFALFFFLSGGLKKGVVGKAIESTDKCVQAEDYAATCGLDAGLPAFCDDLATCQAECILLASCKEFSIAEGTLSQCLDGCLSDTGSPSNGIPQNMNIEIDSDGDGVIDSLDNCPFVENPYITDENGYAIAYIDENLVQPNNDLDVSGDACDCDDNNNLIYIGATEICNDQIDNDCDTLIDSADTDCQPVEQPSPYLIFIQEATQAVTAFNQGSGRDSFLASLKTALNNLFPKPITTEEPK